MAIRSKVISHLEKMECNYELIEIDPADSDTAQFCTRHQIPMQRSANALLIATRKEPKKYALCLVLGTQRLDVNKKARELLGQGKVSFATVEDMQKVTGMEVGAVTPFGLDQSIPIYIAAEIMAEPWVIVGAGDRAAKIKIAPKYIADLSNATVVDRLAKGED